MNLINEIDIFTYLSETTANLAHTPGVRRVTNITLSHC